MQKQGKARRKRKDPESRDFTCLCGKSYLSYAAAYTHAKNKHEGEKQYIDGIKKPQREQLKRGRPKEKKVKTQTHQTAQLTLVEATILRLCDELVEAFPKTILEGNEERDQSEYINQYRHILQEFLPQLPHFDFESFQEEAFAAALVKDFNADVAARTKFAVVVLTTFNKSIERSLIQLNTLKDVWKGLEGINEIIASALKQWKDLSQQEEGKHQQEHQEENNSFDYKE